ncbi:hypothetical protein [Sphingomonas trueperi]|uniref:hypothetical protein n=1 Tax=Sphingomonas trueperi TaxID=53317 RepID=UPI000EB0820B
MIKADRFAGKVLLRKRSSCIADLEQLYAERDELIEQLRQLDAMIGATQAYIRELDIRAGDAPADRRLRGARSIREMVLTVVTQAGGPLRASDIQARIEKEFSRRVERTSLSPVLSKLRWAGKLGHGEEGWSIP